MPRIADLPTQPIDPLAAYMLVPAPESVDIYSAEPDTPEDALTPYQELGGYVIHTYLPKPSSTEEPERFRPFADIYRNDRRKIDIARGLGGLGLSVVTDARYKNMRMRDTENFELALTMYGRFLANRSSVLMATQGSQAEGYPDTDDTWGKQYAEELKNLREELKASSLYGPILAKGLRVRRDQEIAALKWEVHQRADGILVVHKPDAKRKKAA